MIRDNAAMSKERDPLPLTALVLAGGAGRRMGGRDKGWLMYREQPLIRHALATVQARAQEVLISANRSLDAYQSLGHRIIRDAREGFCGPLQGMLAGLDAMHTEWLACVPVDCPALPTDLLDRLWQSRGDRQLVIAGDDSGTTPVVALLHGSLRDSLADYLDSGARSVRGWMQNIPHNLLRLTPEELHNINRPEDLE